MYEKMLVPLDGSELAEGVFSYVTELSARLNIDVVLLLVSSPSAHAFVSMQKAYLETTAREVEDRVAAVRKALGGKTVAEPVKVQCELSVGYAADEILKYAEENKISLILMASHGYSGKKRWNVGSVAGKVMSASRSPVA